MEKIYQSHQEVRFSDTDAAGIVYFSNYAMYFDESFINSMRKLHDISWDRDHKNNFLIPIVETKTKFHGPLYAGDEFISAMGIIKVTNKSFRSTHLIYLENDDGYQPIAEGYIHRAVVDYHSFKSIEIPELMRNALEKHSITEDEWQQYRASIIL